ncbi:hypothetical protein P3T27_003738 [Kitasatospora sp. MAA19]|uniref:hypothetical protein n=1 Tax=Kitasatospora sp. MAA19 TaxID=3035090 RepID=UPI002474991B|nr:hypothetical protein [Kitasatospora sp. MAA19]MDH6707009.1 hypothetical protein [Kitasatospora sp. MAA19]
MTRKKSPAGPPYRPQVGELVKDVTTDKNVVYMDTRGGLAYVRPVGGGVEWTVDPLRIQPLPGEPMLVVHIVPAKSRGRLGVGNEGAA